MREQNPFTDPRDANLAEAWEHGTAIGRRRERILIAEAAVVIGLAALIIGALFL